ncbi:MAG: hypothetical protein PHN26_04300, partial [Eubacteriaceae bacterium]|nr:hypothetical protein [Eubacteriaceae bacterium]
CGVRVIALQFAMMYIHTVNGVAVVFPITWVTTSISIAVYYFSGRWKKSEWITQTDQQKA